MESETLVSEKKAIFGQTGLGLPGLWAHINTRSRITGGARYTRSPHPSRRKAYNNTGMAHRKPIRSAGRPRAAVCYPIKGFAGFGISSGSVRLLSETTSLIGTFWDNPEGRTLQKGLASAIFVPYSTTCSGFV